MENVREEPRRAKAGTYSLTWRGHDGLSYSAEARGLDISSAGVGLECPREIDLDTVVRVEAGDASVMGDCFVAHCTRRGMRYHVGLEFSEEMKSPRPAAAATRTTSETNYYDVLQISPKADMETIHRVFRIMALRFHPDNPETGNVEEFLRLKQAYAVLSEPAARAEYNAMLESQDTGPMPIFELKDFVTGVEAESNRRLGVLSLLYNQRRTDPDHPGVSLLDLEKLMGFPREYLSFTMWYLRAKDLATAGDNSDYALTATGVDFVELNANENEIMTKLIKPGMAQSPASKKTAVKPQRSSRLAPAFRLESAQSNKGPKHNGDGIGSTPARPPQK